MLGLPNSVAWLGWVAGPLCLIGFFLVSLWSSILLSRLYCIDGIEFARYHHAVEHVLGRRWGSGALAASANRQPVVLTHPRTSTCRGAVAIAVFQLLNLVLSDIGGRLGRVVWCRVA